MSQIITYYKRSNNHIPATYHLKSAAANLLPFLFTITCILPLFWLLYSTFKTNVEFEIDVVSLPKALNFVNYSYVMGTTPIFSYLLNTVRNTTIAMFFIILFGFVNGYFLSRFRFRFRNALYLCYVTALFIPIHALLVPTYLMFSLADLDNHWYSTIPAMIATQLTTSNFLVISYVSTVPKELEEAAAIDGSSFTRTLFTIIMPIVMPALVTAGIIAFFHCWNEFSYALVLLSQEGLSTIALALTRFKSENRIDYPKMMTAMVISMIPALFIYMCFSKRIIKGMVAGALKG